MSALIVFAVILIMLTIRTYLGDGLVILEDMIANAAISIAITLLLWIAVYCFG